MISEKIIKLNDDQCWLLALFLKRICYNSILECAVDKDECEEMITVIEAMRNQMAQQGIAPR